MIALGSTTLAGDPASAGPGQRLQLPSKRVDAKRSRPGSVSHRVPRGAAAALRARSALPCRKSVPGHPGRLRHAGPAQRGSRVRALRRRIHGIWALVASPAGLSYFTIRAGYETGANFSRTARDRLRRGPKRHAQGPVHHPLALDSLRGLASACRDAAVAPQDDLEAYALQRPERCWSRTSQAAQADSSLSWRNACHATGPAAGLGKPLSFAGEDGGCAAGEADCTCWCCRCRRRARIRRCMKRPGSLLLSLHDNREVEHIARGPGHRPVRCASGSAPRSSAVS